MRIVHILQGKANPETMNGVNKVVHWMATSQVRQGHDVEVWGLVASKTLPPQERNYRLRLFSVTRLRITLDKELKQAIDQLAIDTWIQFHSVFILEFPAIAARFKRRGFLYGVTPHGGYAPGVFAKNPWRKRLYTTLRESYLLRNAAWAQVIGKTEIEEIHRLAPKARTVFMPNCLEPLARQVSPAPITAERPLIGYCGRLTIAQKGLDILVAGFAAYKQQGGTGELWLIGDGADRTALERYAVEKGTGDQVRFLGAIHGQEKLSIIASFDAFVHSSRWDVFPTACLEAASLARPLLVSQETNMADHVLQWNAGLVFEETTSVGVTKLLKQVQLLYEDNRLKAMGENAKLLVENELKWEEHAKRFVAAVRNTSPSI